MFGSVPVRMLKKSRPLRCKLPAAASAEARSSWPERALRWLAYRGEGELSPVPPLDCNRPDEPPAIPMPRPLGEDIGYPPPPAPVLPIGLAPGPADGAGGVAANDARADPTPEKNEPTPAPVAAEPAPPVAAPAACKCISCAISCCIWVFPASTWPCDSRTWLCSELIFACSDARAFSAAAACCDASLAFASCSRTSRRRRSSAIAASRRICKNGD